MSNANDLWWSTDKEDRLYISSCPQLASGFSIGTDYWLPVTIALNNTEHSGLQRGEGWRLTSTPLLANTAKTIAARRFLGREIN